MAGMVEQPEHHERRADGVTSPSAGFSATGMALLAAALADGRSVLLHTIIDEPVRLLIGGLRQLGITLLESRSAGHIEVTGHGGHWIDADLEIDCGRQPAATNLLLAACALGQGQYRLTGAATDSPAMKSLASALIDLGLRVHIEEDASEPAIQIGASLFRGGRTILRDPGAADSVSSLLLIAGCAAGDLFIETPIWPSRPDGLAAALRVLDKFGVAVIDDLGNRFIVPAPQVYAACECDLAEWKTSPL